MDGKFLAVLLALAAASAVAADIVKWTDANGKVHYGEKAPPGVQSSPVQDRVQSSPASAGSSDAARRSPDAGGRARIDDADAVPYLKPAGRDRYREFLSHASPRAFVICPDGRFSTLYVVGNYQDKLDKMLRERQPGCEPYAVNDAVVWGGKGKVDAVNTPPPPAEAPRQTPSWEEEERAFQRRRIARGDGKPAADPRGANCQEARFTLRQMDGKRVYRTGKNGERIYMEDSERAGIEQKARESIEKNCPR